MKIKISVEFEKDEINTLKDVIFNATDKFDISDEEALELWGKLPDEIKLDVCKWGINDTPTREDIYEWIKENQI